ncbi:5-(carboxyamino)imidazole ribonucleotide synthase [Hyphomicrobium sp.]|uniref:5-(carboxyamino)imidazole ribonucleotide synthase n=1 Tax=Hyphomicrobium sp. TaxID=82 RepID=UPI002FDC9F9E
MSALPPGSTIGILGGGQLGRMLALAAARLGLKAHVYTDVPGGACEVAAAATVAPFEDTARIRAFAENVDVVTYEFENVPLQAAAAAELAAPVRPGSKALAVAQDRLEEKTFISGLGIPVAPFAAVDGESSFDAAMCTIGPAGILKTRRLGYDGKGQVRIKSAGELVPAFESLGRAPSVLEGFVPFAFEVSVLVVRALSGETRFYDIPLNTHRNGILDTSTVPSPLPHEHAARAREIAGAIATALDYVGVLGVEMFYVPDGTEPLVVNEIAPRVHNSGHWTMDACLVSQFENHIRAVAGWPLGETDRHSDVTMTNLIGDDVDQWPALAAEAGVALHLYGKPEARPGRKMGHVNRLRPRR